MKLGANINHVSRNCLKISRLEVTKAKVIAQMCQCYIMSDAYILTDRPILIITLVIAVSYTHLTLPTIYSV